MHVQVLVLLEKFSLNFRVLFQELEWVVSQEQQQQDRCGVLTATTRGEKYK